MTRVTVKLVSVVIGDFRKSEHTLYKELPSWQRSGLKDPHDCICFVSSCGNQLLFVYKVERYRKAYRDKIIAGDLVASVRMRVTRGRFSLATLNDTAKKAGIRIRNFAAIQDFYEESLAAFAA